MEDPQNGWFIMEKSHSNGWFGNLRGTPLTQETSISAPIRLTPTSAFRWSRCPGGHSPRSQAAPVKGAWDRATMGFCAVWIWTRNPNAAIKKTVVERQKHGNGADKRPCSGVRSAFEQNCWISISCGLFATFSSYQGVFNKLKTT